MIKKKKKKENIKSKEKVTSFNIYMNNGWVDTPN